MKKYYIALLFLVFLGQKGLAQFTAYPNEVLFNWAAPYKSFEFDYVDPNDSFNKNLHFRLKYPNDFDSLNGTKKYPVILFFHGFGERGTDNENQLKHGGRRTLDAINSGEFPGMAVYPQIEGTSWGINNLPGVVALLDELIEKCNADPDRIYVHGLSLGAEGVWRFAESYPQYTTAIFPMSGVAANNDPVSTGLRFIPTWLSQGGRDNRPTPGTGNSRVRVWREQGANIRYSYMPETGHGTWNAQYSKPDFFTWFLEKHKTDITVLYGQSSFCEGDPINITLGITAGFPSYEWVKNDTINGALINTFAGANTINVTDTGKYYVRFQRANGIWTKWSKPVHVNRDLEGASQPTATVGNQSLNLPTIAGQQSVQINGPQGLDAYKWLRNASNIPGATNSTYTTSNSGSYAISVRTPRESAWQDEAETIPAEFRAAPQPCFSEPSEPLVVTTENGLNVPAKPTSFSANLLNDNSIIINWDDNSTNELAFELYRSVQSGSGYTLVQRIESTSGANPQAYIDTPLSANTTFYYRMRAVNNSGGSDYTGEVSASTLVDTQAPSAPVLNLIGSSTNSVSLEWTASVDNVGVVGYDILRNNALVASLPNDQFQFTNTGLAIDQTYSFVVRAKDATGNVSLPSNQVTAKTSVSSGINYTYYHHGNFSSVDQIESGGTVIKTGIMSNFNLSTRERDNQFAYIFEGLVEIPTAGEYTFFTNSDDGSKLYINNQLVVDNDGTHGCQQRSGTITLPVGLAAIRVPMFENGGGQCLEVRWQGPGISKQFIPNNRLFNNSFELTGFPAQPTDLQAAVISNKQVDLSWLDNSNNEDHFEIYRSLTQNSNYQLVHLAAANAVTWSDTNLSGATTYYYKIKAINLNGSSTFSGPISVTTASNPAAPLAPDNLMLSVENSNLVRLNWTDNSSDEFGFEIYRSTSSVLSTFTLIHTTAAEVESYLDQQTEGNSTYYYKVRAKGDGNFSDFTIVENITTDNNPPVIAPIIDRSVKFGTTTEMPITANDPDGDPITFSFVPALPPFMSFQDNGYGSGLLSITSNSNDANEYTIKAIASDGLLDSDTAVFKITISDNENPFIAPITNITITEGLSQTLNVDASDETMSALTLSASNVPNFVTFVDNGFGSGTFFINPDINQNGVYSNVRLLADDGNGGFSEEVFNITVNVARRNFSVLVNFGPALSAPSPWNNIRGDGQGKGDRYLKSNDGVSEDIRFVNQGQWYNSIGTTAINSSLYIPEVTQSFSGNDYGTSNFTLRELNPSLSYDLIFYAGELNSPDSRVNTVIEINGTVQSLNPNNNTNTTLDFINQKPDQNGNLFVQVRRPSGSQNGDEMILNSVVIDVYYEDGLPPAPPSNLSLTAISNSQVALTWQDNSNNEQGFEIYRSDGSETGPFTLVGEVLLNETTYNDENLSGNTTYYYKVRAVNSNAVGNEETQVAFITTENSAPDLTNVDDVVISAGDTLLIALNASDAEGDAIILSAASLPGFAQLTDNEDGTGLLTIIPTANDAGFYGNNIIEATDIFGLSDQASFSIQVVDNEFENTVYLNFSNSSTAGPPWNNIAGSYAQGNSYSLNNFNGMSTTIELVVGSGWDSIAVDGMTSGNNSYLYEDPVYQGYWKSEQSAANLKLTGLDPAKFYTVDVLGSSNQWLNTEANYTVAGKTRANVNVTKNINNVLTFSGVQSDQAGEMLISLNRFNSETDAMFINALVIKENILNEAALMPTKFEVKGVSKTEIQLKWQDNAVNETGYQVYVTDEIGKAFTLLANLPANAENYKHSGLVANTAKIYKVRAVSGSGNSDFTPELAGVTINRRILININTDISDYLQAAPPWNNTNKVPETGLVFDDLVDSTNTQVDVIFSIEDIGDGSNNKNGFTSGDLVYPSAVMEAYYFFEPNALPGIFKLSSLEENMAYDLTFLGSHGNGLFAITDFTVGDKTVTNFGKNNRFRTSTIYDVFPEGDSILFEVDASNENQALYGLFNSLVITEHLSAEVALDKIAPATPENLVANNITENSLDLLWNTATDNVGLSGYEVYQNGELISFTREATLILIDLLPDYQYIFAVRAVDRNGNKSAFSEDLIVNTAEPAGDFITYYYKGAGALHNVNSWSTLQDGTGTEPANFTSENNLFILNSDATLASDWSISGAGSRLEVSNNVVLTLDANLQGAVSAMENAGVIVNVDASPDFNEMHPSSSVSFNAVTNSIPSAKYGNLSLGGGPGANKQFDGGNITIEGALNVVEGVALNGVNPNSTSIVAKGTVAFHGVGGGAEAGQMLSLVMAGTGEQQIQTFDGDINLFALHVRQGANVVFNTANPEMQINLGTSNGGGLIIENDASLNIAHHRLLVNGRGVINPQNQTGTIRTNKGILEVHSSSTAISHLYFEPGNDTLNLLLADMVNLGRVEINSPLYIAEELQVMDGIVDAQNGHLTMVSTVDGTAYISEIQNRGEIQGTINAQRYVAAPPNRMYRYFGSMVKNATVADWQQHIAITGNFAGKSTGPGLGSNPSVYYYDENTVANWMPYPTTSNQEIMEAGKGFIVFVRDVNNPLTLELTGEPVQGDFEFDLVANGTGNPEANGGIGDGWNLIANPYQSPIQWDSTGWSSSNLSPILSIWDSDAEGGGKYYYAGAEISDSSFNGEVAAGQGFWVQATGPNPQLTISESAKLKNSAVEYFRSTEDQPVQLTIRLAQGNKEDKAFIRYSENGAKKYDVAVHGRKRANAIFNISTASDDGVDLAINQLPMNFCRDSIAIVTTNLTPGTYELSFGKLETFQHNEVFTLIDYFTQNEVSINSETNYSFEVNDANGPSGKDRFALIIQKPEIDLNKTILSPKSVICETEELPSITVQNAQKGVFYTVWMNGKKTAVQATGQGADLTIPLSSLDLDYGKNIFKFEASFSACAVSTLTDSVTIDYVKLPVIVSSVEDQRICSNESALIEVETAENGVLFRWYIDEFAVEPIFESMDNKYETAELYTSTTYYYSIVNSNGCESAERQAVNVIVEDLAQPVITYEEGLLQSSIQEGNQWYFNGELISGATGSTLEVSQEGIYSVSVTNGICTLTSDNFQYLINSSKDVKNFSITLYPNPTHDDFQIAFTQIIDEDVEMRIVDLTGREILKKTLKKGAHTYPIQADKLVTGTYIIQIIYHKKPFMSRLIVN